MKKNILFIILITSLTASIFAQTTYKLKKIEVLDPRNESWIEQMVFAKLQIIIDDNKNITFSDYNMVFMEILAGKEYIGSHDFLVFNNEGLAESNIRKSYDSYNGKLNLKSSKNFTESSEAFVKFMFFPRTRNLGIIEISNHFCKCHVRLWLQ
jgi:hypothetical protein